MGGTSSKYYLFRSIEVTFNPAREEYLESAIDDGSSAEYIPKAGVDYVNDPLILPKPSVYTRITPTTFISFTYMFDITMGFNNPETRSTFEVSVRNIGTTGPAGTSGSGFSKFSRGKSSVTEIKLVLPEGLRTFKPTDNNYAYVSKQFRHEGREYELQGTFGFFTDVSVRRCDVTFSYTGLISRFTSSSPPVAALALNSCPSLRIFYSTDIYSGINIGQVIMNNGKCYSQYLPRFEEYIVNLTNNSCPNWSAKVLAIATRYYKPSDADALANRIAEYGFLRYFLWYILTGVWSLEILRRSLDTLFFTVLDSNQEYRCWMTYFTKETSQEVAQYFIE